MGGPRRNFVGSFRTIWTPRLAIPLQPSRSSGQNGLRSQMETLHGVHLLRTGFVRAFLFPTRIYYLPLPPPLPFRKILPQNIAPVHSPARHSAAPCAAPNTRVTQVIEYARKGLGRKNAEVQSSHSSSTALASNR